MDHCALHETASGTHEDIDFYSNTVWKGLQSVVIQTNSGTFSCFLFQISKKRKREADQKDKLDECFNVKTDVLPDCCPRPSSSASTASGTCSNSESLIEQPLKIHGLSVPEYQRLYHSVVDRMLVTPLGNPKRYSLELGRRIKHRLWVTLNCPSFVEEEQANDCNQIIYTKKFSTPTLKSYAPHFELDISDEPEPEPKRYRGTVYGL